MVFDVSHLGTVRCDGPEMFEALQSTLTNDLSKVAPGRAQYTHLLNDEGFVVDDIIVWWVGDRRVRRHAQRLQYLRASPPRCRGVDVTSERCVLAVQGPQARAKVADGRPALSATWDAFASSDSTTTASKCAWPARATPESPGSRSPPPTRWPKSIFRRLVAAEITPAGLGARDTLRLEAALPLYGHELTLTARRRSRRDWAGCSDGRSRPSAVARPWSANESEASADS